VFPRGSVLDLDAFERCKKAEDLGDSGGMSTTNSNLNDASNSLRLFRFLQLLCEGHNLGTYSQSTFTLSHEAVSGLIK